MPRFLNETVRNWTGRWIFNPEANAANSYACFRREIDIPHPQSVRIFVTADTRYRLFVNGTYVRTGPVQSQPYHTYYDEQDLSPYLTEGRNCLAFEVFYGGHVKNSRAGLLYEVEDDNHIILAASDGQTRSLRGTAWTSKTYGIPFINRYAPYQEFYDARREPLGWKTVGFDDGTWAHSQIVPGRNRMNVPPVQGAWTKLTHRPIPDMRSRTVTPSIIREEECLFIKNRFRAEDLSLSLSQPGQPLRYASIDHETDKDQETLSVTCRMDDYYGGMYNPSILLDFGTEVTAYFEMELEGHAGQTVEIGYAERLIDGYFNNALECPFADCYTLREGKQTFRAFNWRGYRYVRLIFKDCREPLRIHALRGITTEYPFDFRGGFRTSDHEMQDVFGICRHTIELCCNEAIVDTPWREQSQWMGDVAAVTLGGIYSLYGDTALPRKFLLQSAANQLQTGFITNTTNTTDDSYPTSMIDYNFWWVISVWQHYMYTGDRALITRLYPTVCRMMQASDEMRDEYGLLNRVSYLIFFDWAPNDPSGESCGLNAIYYGALQAFRHMAELKHDEDMIDLADTSLRMIRENFSARFFSKERGVFTDANTDDVPSPVISEACNMLPIYFGLASASETASAIDHILIRKDLPFVEACPFLAFYTLRALAKAGRMDLALAMIREKWYGRFVAKGEDSTVEEWDRNGSYRSGEFQPIMRSLSHAWSAGPAEFLVKDVNAIEILEPGGTKLAFTPCTLPFDYEVTYPTPAGCLIIRQENGKVTYTADPTLTVMVR